MPPKFSTRCNYCLLCFHGSQSQGTHWHWYLSPSKEDSKLTLQKFVAMKHSYRWMTLALQAQSSANNCPDHSQAQLQKHLTQAFHSLKILKGRIFTSQEFTMRACMLRCVCLFATPWTVAHQAPLSMEFSGKSTVVGHHFLLQGIFLTQGSNLPLLHGKADSLPLSQLRSTRVYHKSF